MGLFSGIDKRAPENEVERARNCLKVKLKSYNNHVDIVEKEYENMKETLRRAAVT